MKKIMFSLTIAIAGITAFKSTTHNNIVAAETATVASVSNQNIHLKKVDSKKADSKKVAKADTHADLRTDHGFFRAILKALGAKETPEKMKFLSAWRQGEGGKARNNPFNTTKDMPGKAVTKYNSVGVRNYPDRKTGLEATVATLKLSHYKHLVTLLKKDNVTAKELAHSAALKKWGTGNRVKQILATGRINPPAIAA